MIQRNLLPSLTEALGDTPVVFLQGARQVGKSTLAQGLADREPRASYVTLDDASTRAAASADPQGFVDALPECVVIDEVQRVPGLLPAIKLQVDRRRQAGRFLLTGSANVLAVPAVAEYLAGRVEVQTLWPLSQGELLGRADGFVDAVLADSLPRESSDTAGGMDTAGLVARLLRGGFPEAIGREDARRRGAWFGSYLTTILEREVRDLSRIEGLADLPRLLGLVATRTAQLLNVSDISRSLGTPLTTVRRYLALLEGTFLLHSVPPWFANVGKRFVRSPKAVLTDSGLTCSLLGLDQERLLAQLELTGRLCEGFVGMELTKQLGWSRIRAALFHYRTHAQREVDYVIESSQGRVVGVEVKLSRSLSERDATGMADLADAAGARFHRGVILYLGDAIVPFRANVHAVPLDRLWRW